MIRNYLFRLLKKRNNLRGEVNISSLLKERVISSAHKRDYFITNDIVKYIVVENVKVKIMQRSAHMGYFPRLNYESNKVKLFGNNNIFYDDSKWEEVNLESRLEENLSFSFSQQFLLIHEVLKIFSIQMDETEIFEIIESNSFKTVGDILRFLSATLVEKTNF